MKTKSSLNQTLHKVGQCLYRSAESDIYYAILRRCGQQVKRSLKTTDKELARRRLEDLRQKVSRLNIKEGAAISFQDLAMRWLELVGGNLKPKSKLRRLTCIHQLSPYFQKSVRSITKQDVERWAIERGKEISARTFNHERGTLVLILDYAMRDGLILENLARIISRRKPNHSKIVIPTKAQFKTLLEQIRKGDVRAQEAANLCEFLAYSGCRLTEGTSMLWGDVNFDLKCFTVTGGEQGTKNHEARTIPLFPALKNFLVSLRNSMPAMPQPGERIFTIQSAKKGLATACQKAKLPHFTHHHMRHFFCSNAIEAGIDFKAIAGWLGHKDGGLLVAKTYGHLRDEHSAATAKRMIFTASELAPEPANVVRMAAAND